MTTKLMDTLFDYFPMLLTFLVIFALPLGIFLWLSAMGHLTDAERAERSKPKIVQEIDGCQIYRFQDERNKYIYFTRCGDKITIENYR
jgi:hypothetical protein